jgi:hypothetical protein
MKRENSILKSRRIASICNRNGRNQENVGDYFCFYSWNDHIYLRHMRFIGCSHLVWVMLMFRM